MRFFLAAALIGAMVGLFDSAPALAQARDQIRGKTCNQLFRSCFRICARHQGEPSWSGCEADCNAGQKSCRSTGTWNSKRATVTPQRRK